VSTFSSDTPIVGYVFGECGAFVYDLGDERLERGAVCFVAVGAEQ
jgi:hypothetical protein